MNQIVGEAKKKNSSLELLRCVAMLMVVVLHYLSKGELLPGVDKVEFSSNQGAAAWLLESFCIVAVNLYMLISGYFLCESTYKPKRMVGLYINLWLYSVIIGFIGILFGAVPADKVNIHLYLMLLLPVSMEHYWFMTAYIFLFLLLPILQLAVKKMDKKQLQITLAGLLAMFCLMKSVLPVRLDTDRRGYDVLWYVCVFLTAAYIRKYPPKLLENKIKCVIIYVFACLCVFAEVRLLGKLYISKGALGQIITAPVEYNHLLPFLAAIGLFGAFINAEIIRGRLASFVVYIGSHTLGVYLLHENYCIRTLWPSMLRAQKVSGPIDLILSSISAAIVVFVLGIVVDIILKNILSVVHKLLLHIRIYAGIYNWLDGLGRDFLNS